jgi:membrane-associated protein
MNPVVSAIILYLFLYKYTTLFIVIFFAGLILPLPVNILLMAVGAFSLNQTFDFKTSLWVATIANSLGDIAAYLFFYRYGHSILRDKYIKKYSFFARLENFFKHNSNISIFISRIAGMFGASVNFLSGFYKVPVWKFTLLDVVGNFAFVFIFLSLGYAVGDQWQVIADSVDVIIGSISFILFVLVVYSFYRKKPERSHA